MTDEERYSFDIHGFVVRRNVLGRRVVAELNTAWDSLQLPRPGSTVQSQRFVGHLARARCFRDLLDHPAVLDVVVELCGAYARLDHTYGIVMAPGTAGLGLHGGGSPFDPAQYYVVAGGQPRCGLVAALWSLVGSEPGDGGFACIPGSHRAAYELPRRVGLDHPLVVEIPLGAGDVILFTEALTHGTRPWRAAHERRVLAYKYSPGSSSWSEDHRLPDELAPLLTPRQRLLFQPPSVAYRRPIA